MPFPALLPLPQLFAATSQPPPEAFHGSLWDILIEGGWPMVPLLACSIIAIFLVIFCFSETARRRFVPQDALEQLQRQLAEGKPAEAVATLRALPSALSRALAPALERLRTRPAKGRAEEKRRHVEERFMEGLEAVEHGTGQWISYLNVVAAIAPMLGLLGTVFGMIKAFVTIRASGMGRPELLAGDIGQALVTTAAGLVIGIPAMVFYFILQNRLHNRILSTLETANLLLDHLFGEEAENESPEQPF